MKLWQKTFLCTILCFLIGFDITAVMIVHQSYEMSRTNEIETAKNEQYIIRESISDRLITVAGYYTELNAYNMIQYLRPYVEYYQRQGIFIALFEDGESIYTNFTYPLPDSADLNIARGEKYIQLYQSGGGQYLLIADHMNIPGSNYVFVYIKDESVLMEYWQGIADFTVRTGTIVSVVLAVGLILMFIGLTRPISKLNKAAGEIIKGNYHNRVTVKSNDEIGEFALLFNDMTAGIEKHVEQLSRLTEEKQRFIDNLSHEMRTPVAAISGYGELLKSADLEPEERLMAIDYIISQSRRLGNLSSKLLQLSSLNHENIRMEPIDIGGIIRSAGQTLQGLMKEKSISWDPELEGAGRIIGDADLVESLFQNLFENAVKSMTQGGRLGVSVERPEGHTLVTVTDNGPGIPDEEISRIFEPFYRVDKARTSASGGVGLGLSICRKICDVHQAGFTVQSKLTVGTTITVDFTII